MSEPLKHPLSPADARAVARDALILGRIRYTAHAHVRMSKRAMTTVDVSNVVRAGRYEPAEYENGAWRYRVSTDRMTVVLELERDSVGSLIIVVTTMRRVK